MKALFLTSVYYEAAIQLGDHHLAREFARHGWRIAFVSAPISPFHLFSGTTSQLKERYQNYRSGGIHHQFEQGEIWSYVPGAFLVPKDVPLLSSSFVFKNWYRTVFPSLKDWMQKHHFSNLDLMYLREPKQGGWVERLPHKASIYRIADKDTGFVHFDQNNIEMEKNLAGTADLVIYTAQTLREYVEELNPKQDLYLPNGVDLSSFAGKDPRQPEEYRHMSGPIIVYVGSIKYWFDFELINALTAEFPELNFVIIGPTEHNAGRFIPRDNLYLLGKRPHQEISKYLYHASIALIPFNKRDYPELVNAINPLKLYEYSACGLPVVSTRWKEMEKISSPAKLCNSLEEFKEAINFYLANPINPERQIAFARQHTWAERFQTLMKKLKPILEESA